MFLIFSHLTFLKSKAVNAEYRLHDILIIVLKWYKVALCEIMILFCFTSLCKKRDHTVNRITPLSLFLN